MVVRDQDSGDCLVIKKRLAKIAEDAGRRDVVVRIACRELEAWFLGDPGALATVFERPALAQLGVQKKYRKPDSVGCPSDELRLLLGTYGKVAGARAMGPAVSLETNGSPSFSVFVAAVLALAEVA